MCSGRICVAGALLVTLAFAAFAQSNPPAQSSSKDKSGKKPAQAQAGAQAGKTPPRKRVAIDLSGFDLLEPKKATNQTVVPGATRGIPAPVALAPRLARLFGQRPTFAWEYSGKVDDFTFVLRDDADNEVFRDDARGRSYTYPADAPKLIPGRTYSWSVDVNASPLLAATSEPVGFAVLADKQLADVERGEAEHPADTYDAMMARAQVMVDHRLWYDAIAGYSAIIARFPDKPAAYEGRGNVYAQLAITKKLADADFAQADKLRANVK